MITQSWCVTGIDDQLTDHQKFIHINKQIIAVFKKLADRHFQVKCSLEYCEGYDQCQPPHPSNY